MNNLNEFDAVSGWYNHWRMSAKWPGVGVGKFKIWSSVMLLYIFGFFMSGIIPFIMDIAFYTLIFNLICIVKKMNVINITRSFLQKFGYKEKATVSVWNKRTILSIAFMCMISPVSFAYYTVIIPPAEEKLDQYEISGLPYIEKNAYGHDVRLSDFIQMFLPESVLPVYINSELKDLRINWRTTDRAYLDVVLADVSRRYDVSFMWQASAGNLIIDWADGTCDKAIKESAIKYKELAKQYGTEEIKTLPVIKKVISEKEKKVLIC